MEITSGPWTGHLIRRARKSRICEYGITISGDPTSHCTRVIEPGDLYVEGELNPCKAGGYGQDSYCLDCAGSDAQEAIRNAHTCELKNE